MPDPAGWSLGLARLAALLDRDLQRAARRAGGGERLWAAGAAALACCLGITEAEAAAAARARDAFRATEERDRLAAAGIAYVDPSHPVVAERLAVLHDPPFGLFARGRLEPTLGALMGGPVIGIVGSREATPGGRALARTLAAELGSRGAVIVSGLARGIDAEAHAGALDAGALTVAVLGCGVDRVYPRTNATLCDRVLRSGIAVSEYWPGTSPAPWRFPARNRIIAGLCQALVVVEAGARSGALITADFALELGRPVLAVPGLPGSPGVAGCHELIRAGAALCERGEDVVAEMPGASWRGVEAVPVQEPEGLAGQVLRHLRNGPLDPDELAGLVGAEAHRVAAALCQLEVAGHVTRGQGRPFWAVGPGGPR